MPLPEYIPSDLPQYASSVDRTSFNSAVVQSGDALMFIESGKLIVKKDDGNFYEIGEGSGGTDVSDTTATPADVLVTAAFYDSTGTKQSGTIPTVSAGISGSAVVVPSGYIAAAQTFPVSGGVDVSSTTAEAGGVLSGLIFYDSTGNQTTGTIPTVSAAVSGSNVVVPVGYIGTSQTFPVTGGGIDLSSTTAVSGGVLSGLVFYDSAGNKTTGTIPMVSAAMSGSTLVIQSGYLGVSVAIPIFMDVSSTTITSDMVLSGGIFYDSAGVQRSGTIPTVSAIRSDSEIIVPRGYISSPQQFNVSGGVDVSDTTAEDYMVMSGALFYDSDGNLTTGTIPYVSAPEDMITPTTSYQTISGGGYLDMDIVIEGDPYLVPQNIKAGVWIFGVEGTYGDFSDVTVDPEDVLEDEVFYDSDGNLRSGTIPYAVVPDYWITPTTTSQQIGSGYLDDNVIIAGDSNLVASNIRSGVSIFEVEGEYEGGSSTDFSSTTAVPGGVLSGGVFYDSTGALTTGTIPTVTASIVDNNVVVPAGYIAASQTFPISSGVEAVAGYYVNSSGTLSFQPLSSGASAEAVSSLQIVNTGVSEPEYASGGGATMNFYKCASVTAATSETFYLMSGAGESGCNGTWSATTSSSYDKPIYQNEYGATMVYQGYDIWEIDAPSGDIAWYIGAGSTDPSQITSWTGAGMSPAPSITESSSSTAATWAGYLAAVDSSTGIWNFASAATSGLVYDRITPVVGGVYDEDCTFQITKYKTGIPEEGLVFYAPLDAVHATAETGQDLEYNTNYLSFQTYKNVPCVYFQDNQYNGIYCNNTTGLPAGTSARTLSIWVNLPTGWQADKTFISYGTAQTNKRYNVGIDKASTGTLSVGVWGYGNTTTYAYPFVAGAWTHVVVTYYDGSEQVFVNGESIGSKTHSNLDTDPVQIVIGNDAGAMSDAIKYAYLAAARIYNRVLSASEISALAAEFTPTDA